MCGRGKMCTRAGSGFSGVPWAVAGRHRRRQRARCVVRKKGDSEVHAWPTVPAKTAGNAAQEGQRSRERGDWVLRGGNRVEEGLGQGVDVGVRLRGPTAGDESAFHVLREQHEISGRGGAGERERITSGMHGETRCALGVQGESKRATGMRRLTCRKRVIAATNPTANWGPGAVSRGWAGVARRPSWVGATMTRTTRVRFSSE